MTVPNENLSDITENGPIHAYLFDQCLSYVHPEPWHRLPTYRHARRLPADLAGLRDTLLERFSIEELVAAGVLKPDAREEYRLSPTLSQPEGIIIALRRSDTEAPFDLLTANGCVSGSQLPACASLQDIGIRRRVNVCRLNQIIGTPAIEDAVILQSLQLPATLSTGLETLSGACLWKFCQAYHLEWPNERSVFDDFEEVTEAPRKGLVLVGCRLAEMSQREPGEIDRIRNHFTEIERHLGILTDRISLWRPSQQVLEGIEFCLGHGDPEMVKQAFVNSLRASTVRLVQIRQERANLPRDLPGSVANLQRLLVKAPRNAAEEQLAWANARKLVNDKMVKSLLQQASTTNDPVTSNLCFLAAGIGQLVHPRGLAMIAIGLQQGYLGTLSEIPEGAFNQYMEATDRLLKVLKELEKCQKNPQSLWPHLPSWGGSA